MKYTKYEKEILQEKVKDSSSMRELLSKLDLQYTGGNCCHIKKIIKKYSIDYSHFTGQGWNKGKTFKKKSIQIYLNNEAFIGSDALKKRLINEEYFDKICPKCNNSSWLDDKIPLELHHIDGNHSNNNLSNLILLCPNCHTYEHQQQRKIKHARIKFKQPESLKSIEIVEIKNYTKKSSHTRKSSLKPHKRKVERPSYNLLLEQINSLGYLGTSRLYNVSDNAIRKWVKMYEKHDKE